MPDNNWRERYRFHEREWDNYEALREWFDWKMPTEFNIATQVCERWAERTPDRAAIIARDDQGRSTTWTYSDLNAKASALAGYLRSHGVSAGDRVAVCSAPSPEAASALIACWKVGAVAVPMSTLFGQDALEHRIRDAAIPVAVVDDTESFQPLLDAETPLGQLVTIRPDAPEGTRHADSVPFEEAISLGMPIETVTTAAEDDAILLYTSGTTGDPKPALHVHRYLLNNLPGFLTATCNLDLRDDDVLWTPAEWAWFATLFCVLLPGLYYGKRVLAYDGGAFDPAVALDLIEEATVTQFVAPPTAVRKIKDVDDGTADLSSLRTITCGAHGEEIASWVDERLTDTVVHENYGQTEAGVLIAECTALQETEPGCMGMAVPGYDLELLDPASGEPLSDAADVGELAVLIGDRPICFRQYWNWPKITEETLVDDRLLTGDLVQRAADDTFTFEGRQDYLIISAGHSIGPEEVENCLLNHPAVAEVGVIGITDPERGEVPKAYIELAPGYEGDDELVTTLQNHVRERLAEYKYPRDVTFLSDLPMQRGKVQRDQLRQLGPTSRDGSRSND